jgi:16S rRNA (cytidine1402-2'-O)-methyltransferase
MPGTLFVVATPIGNLEDITLRALAVLKRVSLIAAEDTRRTAKLLARHAIETALTSLHEHNERKKIDTLIARLRRGDDLALVSDAGTPTVSDPGAQLVRACLDAGIRVEPIPGPSAALAALVVSGFSAEAFTFLGFPPTRPRDRREWFEKVGSAGHPVVFFEAPHRIIRTLRELHDRFDDPQVAVARELTKIHEELVKGPISDVLPRLMAPVGEFTVVIDIGHLTDKVADAPLEARAILAEFGRITESSRLGRREAIARLAQLHHRSPNEIYAAIEKAKKSGE